MAFMMPVMKNDWDIYNSRKGRDGDKGQGQGPGRVRKVSESRSEGPALGPRPVLSPHRSAPAMRSLSYTRPVSAVPSRASRSSLAHSPSKGSASPQTPSSRDDKFHIRARASPERSRSRCAACVPYL